jgi:hypothetical protein
VASCICTRRFFSYGCVLFLCIASASTLARPDLHHTTASQVAPLNDSIARVQNQIDQGKVKLTYDDQHGWLASVLRELHVPTGSQGLVFSKTSFQAHHISPHAPRAIYFNDDLYIGWVQGGSVLEIASIDPKKGLVFYTLPQKKAEHPRFVRETSSCLQCHQTQNTADVPSLLMRSVYPDSDGMPVLPAGTFVTTEQSPLKERWGGWYADGKLPDRGMANAVTCDPDHPDQLTQSIASLDRQFDASPYLTAHSDAVALLVLAHQTHLHNLMSRAAVETQKAIHDDATLRQILHEGSDAHSDTYAIRLKSACEPVVEALLFSGEAPLGGDFRGSTHFAQQFESLGPRDSRGRSLRQFDLHTRLFKYPCSYLIYSEQFDALPDAAKTYIYRRLWQVLTGRDDSQPFAQLSDEQRGAIYQILLETKPGLPEYWKRHT